MPIKRLIRNTASFPRIGKIRKGGEKPNDKQPGKDLEYFRFDSDDAHALQRFEAAYGKEPQQLNIYLPYESVEENFQTWQEAYVAGGLKHRCDGETCVIWQKPDGTYSQEPTPCPGGCKEVGRLNVIIPELARLAYVTVETHSINDILQLTDNLQAALALRGRLTGIPFILSRRPQEISTPGVNGKRQRYTKYMLFLEPHPDWVQVQLAAMRHNALATVVGALPEFRQLTVEDDRVVDMETGEVVQHRQLEAPASFKNPDEAIAWGFAQGCFEALPHAKNAYEKLKKEKQPKSASEMWTAWVQNVQERVTEAGQPTEDDDDNLVIDPQSGEMVPA